MQSILSGTEILLSHTHKWVFMTFLVRDNLSREVEVRMRARISGSSWHYFEILRHHAPGEAAQNDDGDGCVW